MKKIIAPKPVENEIAYTQLHDAEMKNTIIAYATKDHIAVMVREKEDRDIYDTAVVYGFRYLHRLHTNKDRLYFEASNTHDCLAAALREEGYRTVYQFPNEKEFIEWASQQH